MKTEPMKYTLERGEEAKYFWTRYGRHGRQLALFVKETDHSLVYVRKYLKNSGRWTGVVSVRKGDYIAPALFEEVAKALRESMPWKEGGLS